MTLPGHDDGGFDEACCTETLEPIKRLQVVIERCCREGERKDDMVK
jgi:hypothetical protein